MKLQKPKYLCAFLAFFLLLSMTALADAAQSWYCMREKNHARPKVEPQMAFIGDYGGVYIGPDPDEKVIYLTFDAGYENGNVERILDVLKKHEAPGAFFVLDNLIKRNTDLVLRMAEEGHLVCNHTAHHKDMTKLSDAEFEAELAALESVYKETTGYDMAKFYRPPEGKFNQENLALAQRLGYTTVFWSLAYADWDNNKQPAPTDAKKLLMDNIHNGAIVLLHPTSKTNADILDDLLTAWEAEGYRFGSLTELAGPKE
jgi:delta-lactam-biosynthetic de-N-acetylase